MVGIFCGLGMGVGGMLGVFLRLKKIWDRWDFVYRLICLTDYVILGL